MKTDNHTIDQIVQENARDVKMAQDDSSYVTHQADLDKKKFSRYLETELYGVCGFDMGALNYMSPQEVDAIVNRKY